jgi:hypothetical protein
MATCDMGYDHAEVIAEPEPEPVVVEAGPNENDVAIAEIEAAASVEREKIYTEQRGLELEGEVERLRGELHGMRTVLETLAPPEPEPDPEPVVVPMPEPEPIAEPVAGPPETVKSGGGGKKGDGWWGNYR